MKGVRFLNRVALLSPFSYQVWILALGRMLSQLGTGFTLFYAPIFFVNQVGLSATAVGLGVGCSAISGTIGRIVGGSLCDSDWGRKPTVILSAIISAIASLVLAATSNFPIFLVGNLLLGLGIGLYWPATEAMVADLTLASQRNEAYAIHRLGDSLGLGLGVVLGGLLIGATGAYRSLFLIDAVSFLVFLGIVAVAIDETKSGPSSPHGALGGWKQALNDRTLLVFVWVNVMFTTYIVQITSTLPLYFSNFVRLDATGQGFTPLDLSGLFTWHLALAVLFQLPVARSLRRFSHAHSLMLSALLWAVGFGLVWLTGVSPSHHHLWAIAALAVLTLATVSYLPSASAMVVEFAPVSLRGVYMAINSQCWAIGTLIGPPLGGWMLDQSVWTAHGLWLVMAASVTGAISILSILHRMAQRQVSLPSSLVGAKGKD